MTKTKNAKRPQMALGLVALAAVGGLVLSGCTSNEEKPQAAETSAAQAQAPEVEVNPDDSTAPTAPIPTVVGPPPEALDVKDQTLQETAVKYINERENQASQHHKKPGDWLTEAKKYMTENGYKQLTQNMGPVDESAGGYAWNVSHEQGLAVKVVVGECTELTQGSSGKDNEKTVMCPVTDIVVDKDGKNVATTNIPPTWPYVGEQQDALLLMKKSGEGWKVDMDMTGMAN